MKLTTEQINQLYTFTRQHYVEWYDLQTELVDHLANAIEEQWQENPKLSFNEALQNEFKKFGVFGFMDVVEGKQRFLQKKYNQIVWSIVKTFFTLPKIMGTIGVTGVLFLLLKSSHYNGDWVLLFYGLLVLFALYGMISNRMKHKKQIQKHQKRWLFEDIMNQYGGFSGAIIFPLNLFLQLFNRVEHYISNTYFLVFASFFLVLMTILMYVIFFEIPSKSKKYLLQTYPEYSLAIF
ncbi:hypothetical protein [Flavobacterium succinicans]|uniref:Uncharacterized protein n=1 Tax=Flavobacterium succinicans TaxID=29536 RepID=A0A199XPZ3_9FLAO|nr:hypothetical protein [Flavobacterium succinicans]OAZ03326.1 hypothetical protein FLB_21130 [Flavobacterium succinicans]